MIKGKKSLSEKIFLNNIIQIQKSCFKNYTLIILNSVLNNMPLLYVRLLKKKKRKKKDIKHIPYVLATFDKKKNFSIKLLIHRLKKKKKKSILKDLKTILLNLSENLNNVNYTKKEIHEFIFFKKSFSHYRWF